MKVFSVTDIIAILRIFVHHRIPLLPTKYFAINNFIIMKQLIPLLAVILTCGLIFTCTPNPVDPACCKIDGTVQGPGLSHYIVSLTNVLTPNGDGFNEIYYVEFFDTVTNCIDTTLIVEFTVYKNASIILFHDANYHNNFTGLDNNGNKIPDGNYKVEFKLPNGTICSKTLSLTRVPIHDPACNKNCKMMDPADPLLI